MTRTDSFVVGTLVLLLAIVAGLIGIPAIQLAAAPAVPASTPPGKPIIEARPYVEGVLGASVSVTPLTARTQVDRDLVALVFAGLVRQGPDGAMIPDLAERWAVDPTGTTWTVDLRGDARWHDGQPVTADDVVFTIRTLQDPEYRGPSATSWTEVTVVKVDRLRVTFTLETPLGGFLQALTQPLAPAHVLGDVPVSELPDDPFGQRPVGSGPFALVDLTETSASLIPPSVDDGTVEPAPSGVDSFATAGPTERPTRPVPYLPGIEFQFFTTPDDLAAAFRAGDLDGASGLSPQLAAELGAEDGVRLLRYPGSTLTAVLLNLRPSHPEFGAATVRTGLLAAIDRSRLIDEAFADSARAATGPIPPSSWLFDAAADPPVAHERAAAGKGFRAADWTRKEDGWYLPKATKPLSIEVLSPTQEANPGLFAAAQAVVRDWTAMGLAVTHVPLAPGVFVTDRLATGMFAVALADVTIGPDPDLYPLLASSQTLTGGSNVMGVQDPALDVLLAAARKPGTDEQRITAYSALQKQLAKGRYLLPLAFADEVVVVRDTLEGVAIGQVTDPSDRFWDVLTWRLAVDR